MITRTNTILYCKKWRETVAFYRDTLELPVETENGWFIEFRLGETAFLSVANEKRASIKTAHGLGITLAWQVENVAGWRSRLLENGVACTSLQERWGALVTYLHDPEGHRIELWQPLQ